MNKASKQGGAIYYTQNRPLVVNCTFIQNEAPYGSNIASYPTNYWIEGLESLTINDVASGQKYHG